MNKAMDGGATPLRIVSQEGHYDVVQYLIDKVALVETTYRSQAEDDGETPLLSAADCDRLDVVKLLIEACVDAAKSRTDGSTPLAAAKSNGHTEVVQYLELHLAK